MQTIEIKLYEFKELDGKAKENALREFRDINTDFEWWDFIFEDFKSICKTLGIDADTKKMYFRGFYSQGDGSSFDASVNVPALADGILQEKWKEYAPSANFSFPTPVLDSRLKKLFVKGLVGNPGIISKKNYCVGVEQDYDFEYNKKTDFSNMEKALRLTSAWVGEVAQKLNRFLYASLQNEYEERTSDKAVEEGIEINEYLFTADGVPATRLLRLSGETSITSII